MNQVTLLGRSGANAEVKYAQNGTAVLSISLATSEKQGESWVSTWHRVVVFGKRAEQLAMQVKKGSELFVFGKISNRQYTNKDGQKVNTSEVIASWIRVCEKTQTASQAEAPQGHQQEQYGSSGMSEDDIPF